MSISCLSCSATEGEVRNGKSANSDNKSNARSCRWR
ncbi:IS1 family transposase, partial [Candidatus Erwinia dacicola]